jgi:hypothetical protein
MEMSKQEVQSALNSLKQGADYPWGAGDQFEDDVEILPTLALHCTMMYFQH